MEFKDPNPGRGMMMMMMMMPTTKMMMILPYKRIEVGQAPRHPMHIDHS
jgi:hypothetical protein